MYRYRVQIEEPPLSLHFLSCLLMPSNLQSSINNVWHTDGKQHVKYGTRTNVVPYHFDTVPIYLFSNYYKAKNIQSYSFSCLILSRD